MDLSQYSQEAIANWIVGSAFPAAPTALEMALSTSDPQDDGSGLTEPATLDGYSRQSVVFDAPSSALGAGTSSFNTSPVVFGPAQNTNWSSVTHASIFDSGVNAPLFHGPLVAQRTVIVSDTLSFAANKVQPQILPSMSHYLGNMFLNWMRGTAADAAPAGLELALSTTDPLEDGSGITEPTGGYARQPITFAAPITTNGVGTLLTQTSTIIFGPATANWGAITHAAVFVQGTNTQLIQGAVAASRNIVSGDAYAVSPGAINVLIR